MLLHGFFISTKEIKRAINNVSGFHSMKVSLFIDGSSFNESSSFNKRFQNLSNER